MASFDHRSSSGLSRMHWSLWRLWEWDCRFFRSDWHSLVGSWRPYGLRALETQLRWNPCDFAKALVTLGLIFFAVKSWISTLRCYCKWKDKLYTKARGTALHKQCSKRNCYQHCGGSRQSHTYIWEWKMEPWTLSKGPVYGCDLTTPSFFSSFTRFLKITISCVLRFIYIFLKGTFAEREGETEREKERERK